MRRRTCEKKAGFNMDKKQEQNCVDMNEGSCTLYTTMSMKSSYHSGPRFFRFLDGLPSRGAPKTSSRSQFVSMINLTK